MNETNPYSTPQNTTIPSHLEQKLGQYASFWKRLVALIIDTIVITIIGGVIGVIIGFGMVANSGGNENIEFLSNIAGVLVAWLYDALLESSYKQATWGKQIMQIKVSDLDGNRISFLKATGRHYGKYISLITLCIGYLMMLWTEKKQTLHDMMAGCLVTRDSAS